MPQNMRYCLQTALLLAVVIPAITMSDETLTDDINILGIVRELDDIEVPAKRDGLIEELHVRRGHLVANNQLVASLEKSDKLLRLNVTKAELEQAKVKAKNDGEIKSAEASVARSKQEARLMEELGDGAVYLEKFRIQNDLVKAYAALSSAQNQFAQDQLAVKVKSNELILLQHDIQETSVLSPAKGIVRELLKNRGEWVKQGEPILVVTRMDRMLVEGFLDSTTTSVRSVLGRSARVTFRIGERSVAFDGLTVQNAAPKLELDGKFPVWVEFNNRLVESPQGMKTWFVRPGMRAQLEILVEPAAEVQPVSISDRRGV